MFSRCVRNRAGKKVPEVGSEERTGRGNLQCDSGTLRTTWRPGQVVCPSNSADPGVLKRECEGLCQCVVSFVIVAKQGEHKNDGSIRMVLSRVSREKENSLHQMHGVLVSVRFWRRATAESEVKLGGSSFRFRHSFTFLDGGFTFHRCLTQKLLHPTFRVFVRAPRPCCGIFLSGRE